MNISYLSLKKKERKKENPNICCFSTPICWVLFCCCCFLQYTNLIYPGDCIGFVLICVWLYNPMDCSLPGSSVHGIFQARILEWVVISFSRGSSQPRDETRVSCNSCIAGRLFTTEPLGKPHLSWYNGKEFVCQCKRCRFDPWVWEIPWRRKWQPTPAFSPGKSHEQRKMVDYNPWGPKELDMT